ncbi:hypothetical protein GE09DRAFT_1054283 [Coniochaeta sp. 2T2.1]|nr:hypothetical protein GE09DRAFT_1054283 [Coniochaeta sp. 2T2.1]
MSKRTTFTTISPLPPNITRDVVLEFLHNHQEMIDLNPLVKERHCIKPPSHATPEEFHCTWYSLTDRISYLPGGLANGDVTYTCAFHDLPNGIQTHCYAPAGLNIRDKWTLNGSLPGEPIEPVELGLGAPITGLYIREDVDMKCNLVMTSFVKKTLKKSHAALIERLKVKAQIATAAEANAHLASGLAPSASSSSSASIRSDLSGRSWAASGSSVSSSPPSIHTSIPSGYISPPSTAPSSGFPSPQYTYSSVPSTTSSTSHHPYELSSNRAPQDNMSQSRYKPLPSPPQHHQQHSLPPPAYGRYPPPSASQPQQHEQPAATSGSTSQPSYHQLPPQAVAPGNPFPQPLRLRQNPVSSSVATSSSTSTPNNSLYRDANGRVTWAAINKTAAQSPYRQPSVRYHVAHPDYPQMNPYSEESPVDRQAQQQGRCLNYGASATGLVVGHVTGGSGVAESACSRGASLRGPFVAELEG